MIGDEIVDGEVMDVDANGMGDENAKAVGEVEDEEDGSEEDEKALLWRGEGDIDVRSVTVDALM